MATFLNASALVNYADFIQAHVIARMERSFLQFINRLPELGSGGDESGAIDVPIITVVTAEDPVDGTLLTNSAAATFTSLVFDDKVHPMRLNKSELGALTPQRLAAHAEAAANSFVVAMEAAVLTQYMAATSSSVLTIGTATGNNFYAPTPNAAERQKAIALIDEQIGKVLAITGQDPGDIALVLPAVAVPTAKSNSWSNVYNAIQVESTFRFDDVNRRWEYANTPVFAANSVATGWGKWDGGTAGMVISKNSGAIVFGGVEDTGFYNDGSGFTARDFRASYASAVLQNTWGELMNAAT